jgi:hypothetical protein
VSAGPVELNYMTWASVTTCGCPRPVDVQTSKQVYEKLVGRVCGDVIYHPNLPADLKAALKEAYLKGKEDAESSD